MSHDRAPTTTWSPNNPGEGARQGVLLASPPPSKYPGHPTNRHLSARRSHVVGGDFHTPLHVRCRRRAPRSTGLGSAWADGTVNRVEGGAHRAVGTDLRQPVGRRCLLARRAVRRAASRYAPRRHLAGPWIARSATCASSHDLLGGADDGLLAGLRVRALHPVLQRRIAVVVGARSRWRDLRGLVDRDRVWCCRGATVGPPHRWPYSGLS